LPAGQRRLHPPADLDRQRAAELDPGRGLPGAEKNDPSASLPKNAESTRVLELARRFTPSDTVPALVVYERAGGVSAADRVKVADDVRRFARVDSVGGQVVGPILARDGAAFQVVVPIRVGSRGSDASTPAVKQLRAIAHDGDGGLRAYVTGPAGYAAAFDDVLKGIDSTLLYITAAIVIGILLLTYRSPVLWLAGDLRLHRPHRRAGGDLPARP
jgi:putative drug exporter of the RND superfamily